MAFKKAIAASYQSKFQVEDTWSQPVVAPSQLPLQTRKLGAEALLADRLRGMKPLYDGVFIDTSLVTHQEYQLFLEQCYIEGKYMQPDHWNTLSFPVGRGNTPVQGVGYKDVEMFCQWLTRRGEGLWRYRLPRREESERASLIGGVSAGYWLERRKISN